MVRTCPSSMHSIVMVRRLFGVRKPSSPMMLPGGSSTPISLTRNFPVTVSDISAAGSPLLYNLSPRRYLRSVMNGLSHSHVTLRRVASLLDELEHLTETNGIDR